MSANSFARGVLDTRTRGVRERQHLAPAIGRAANLPDIKSVVVPRLREVGHRKQADEVIAALAFGAVLDRARDATADLTQGVEPARSGVPVATLARDSAIRKALGALRAAAKNFSSKVSTAGITEHTSQVFVDDILGRNDDLQTIRFLVGRVAQVICLSEESVHRGTLFRVVDKSESLDGIEDGSSKHRTRPDRSDISRRELALITARCRTTRRGMSDAETLLDVFVPPEGLVGHSADLVAMTGAEDFLEAAVQRFSGLRPRQHAELGSIACT